MGDDEHGQWAVQPALTPTFLRKGTVFRMADAVVRCYPRNQWWTASFYGAERGMTFVRPDGAVDGYVNAHEVYVDMSAPPEWTDAGVAFVDLTLDVVRRFDGTVAVLDEDEVDEEAARWSTPADQLARARLSKDRIESLLAAGSGVFDGVADAWRKRFGDG